MRVVTFLSTLLLSSFVCAQNPIADSINIAREPDTFVREAAAGKELKVAKYPDGQGKCPATNNGPGQDYPAHTYTENQIKAAFLGGAKLAAEGKTVGDRKYPHIFGNKEKLPFDCGKDKMEFPIQTNGKVYDGGPVTAVPDRVIFEYKETKKEFIVKFCGVTRHGPGGKFIGCPK